MKSRGKNNVPTWPCRTSTADSLSPITDRELDYLECMIEAYSPSEFKACDRFIVIARARKRGMTFKEIGKHIQFKSLHRDHFRAYGIRAASFLRMRAKWQETEVAFPLQDLKRVMTEEVTAITKRIQRLESQLKLNRAKLSDLESAYPHLKLLKKDA